MRGSAHRVGNLIDRRAIFHDIGIDDQDVSDVGGVLVTSPLRTLIDVARRIRDPENRERANSVVGAMIGAGLVDPREAISRIDSATRLPGSHAARRELERHLDKALDGPLDPEATRLVVSLS